MMMIFPWDKAILISHLCEIVVIEGGNPVLKVDERWQQSDPIVGSLLVVLHLCKSLSLSLNDTTYLDKVNVILLGLSVDLLQLRKQHLVVGGGLVQEDHRQVVVPLDQAVQHGNLSSDQSESIIKINR